MPKYKFKRDKLTSLEEVMEMISKAEEPWLKAIISFLYVFGCRISEALELRIGDVHIFKEGKNLILEVELPYLKKKDKPEGPYEKFHVLRANVNEAPILFPFLKYYLNIKNNLEPYEKVFPYTRVYVWMKLKKLNENISPHVFRHDRLTKLAIKYADPFLLKYWAGWEDLRPAQNYVEELPYRKRLVSID